MIFLPERVRVWVPVPQTDQRQTVRVVTVKAPVKTRMAREPEYGNRMMYAEIQNPAARNSSAGDAEFTLECMITLREYSRGDCPQLKRTDQKPRVVSASMSRLIAPDSLIPTDGKIKDLAVEVTGSQSGAVAKTKAAYAYLFTNIWDFNGLRFAAALVDHQGHHARGPGEVTGRGPLVSRARPASAPSAWQRIPPRASGSHHCRRAQIRYSSI
jgi:hypothetical protein